MQTVIKQKWKLRYLLLKAEFNFCYIYNLYFVLFFCYSYLIFLLQYSSREFKMYLDTL